MGVFSLRYSVYSRYADEAFCQILRIHERIKRLLACGFAAQNTTKLLFGFRFVLRQYSDSVYITHESLAVNVEMHDVMSPVRNPHSVDQNTCHQALLMRTECGDQPKAGLQIRSL